MTWAAVLFSRVANGLVAPEGAWPRLVPAAIWLLILTVDVRHRQPFALVIAEYVVFGATGLGALYALRRRPEA
ncbi:MAG: hypothetical protein ABIX10_00390 [Acidimicrobiales bacterium]